MKQESYMASFLTQSNHIHIPESHLSSTHHSRFRSENLLPTTIVSLPFSVQSSHPSPLHDQNQSPCVHYWWKDSVLPLPSSENCTGTTVSVRGEFSAVPNPFLIALPTPLNAADLTGIVNKVGRRSSRFRWSNETAAERHCAVFPPRTRESTSASTGRLVGFYEGESCVTKICKLDLRIQKLLYSLIQVYRLNRRREPWYRDGTSK